jgi:hypothetical protein
MSSFSRRGFIARTITAAFGLAVGKSVYAKECPASAPEGVRALDPESAVGKRLEYIESIPGDFTHAKFEKGQNCENCQFYQLPRAKDGYGPCTMAAMAFVNKCGWCNLYRVRPS